MSVDDFEFSSGEVEALTELKATLRQVAEWPPESPLSFVLSLAPRTRGKLGEMLVRTVAEQEGVETGKAESVAYDLRVRAARCEVKFSTEDPPRFQQVRDPRSAAGNRYDYLICVSGRPHGLIYWIIPADALGDLMDDGYITVQHAMSDTKWFLPSRIESDTFASFRLAYEEFRSSLAGL